MNEDQESLLKTLCAMRWIALMNGNSKLAEEIDRNYHTAKGQK